MTPNGKKPAGKAQIVFAGFFMAALLALGVSLACNRQTEPTYSQEENRMLQGMPQLTLQSMLKGSFSGQFENYLLDHFVFRSQFTAISRNALQLMSIASMNDTMLALDDQNDELTQAITALPTLPDGTAEPTTEPGAELSAGPSAGTPLPSGIDTDTLSPALSAQPSATASSETAVTATSVPMPKPTYGQTVGIYYKKGDKRAEIRSFPASYVEYAAKVLNNYAACLPEGGKLCYIMTPRSSYMNMFIADKGVELTSDVEDCLRANVSANVEVFSVPEVLGEPLARGEYVYFRSDMHWTPLGAHYVYEAMMKKLGKTPVPYSQYTIQQEYPFLGTLYRSYPSAAMKNNPDTLDLIQPLAGAKLYKATAPDQFEQIQMLDMNASGSDRYTVYLGGSDFALSVIKTSAATGKKALVVKDSFGLCFSPQLAPNYDEIYIVDPRYFNRNIAGGTVKELIKKYGINDCFVILYDGHSYGDSFLMSMIPNILGK